MDRLIQPLVSLAEARIYGYESLIRAPDDSPLRFPDDLFAAAVEGCVDALEWHCCLVATREFARSQAPGKLVEQITVERDDRKADAVEPCDF